MSTEMFDRRAFILCIFSWICDSRTCIDVGGSCAAVSETQLRPYKGELWGVVCHTVGVPLRVCVYTAELATTFSRSLVISH